MNNCPPGPPPRHGCPPKYTQQGHISWLFPEGCRSEQLHESLRLLRRQPESWQCMLGTPSLARDSQGKEGHGDFRGLEEQCPPQEQNGLRDELALCSTQGLQLAPRPPGRLCQLPRPPPSLEPQIWEQDSCPGAVWPQTARERVCSLAPPRAICSPGREAGLAAPPLPRPLQRNACGREKSPGGTVTVPR